MASTNSELHLKTDTPMSKASPEDRGQAALSSHSTSPIRRPDSIYQVQHNGNEGIEMHRLQGLNLPAERTNDSVNRMSKPISRQKFTTALKRFWKTCIEVDVDLDNCRDYLALERTFLSYIRTAAAFALFGVSAAQLFRLDSDVDPSQVSSYYHLGRPVRAVAEVIAVIIVLIGAGRCWVQQQKLLRGYVRGGGWELFVFVGLAGALLLVVLIFLAGDTATGLPE
ncbi:hypothetical protein BDV97DRAFT_399503 [Delphinella strobiligena]|nr:hypothetical protein BDV97DRAFT_399503 [Delphinella strobiligena]